MAWRAVMVLVIMHMSASALALQPKKQEKHEEKSEAKHEELPPGKEERTAFNDPEEHSYFFRSGTEAEPLLAMGLRMVVEGGVKLPAWFDRAFLGAAVGYGYFPQMLSISKGLFMCGATVAGEHSFNEQHHLQLGFNYSWGINPAAPLSTSRAYTIVGLVGGYSYRTASGLSFVGQLRLEREQFSWFGQRWIPNLSPVIGVRYGF